MTDHYVAWWNVENLFDVEDSQHRTDKLQRTLRNELEGWNDQILDKKLDQLASIISQMNDNNGPDILGVCEVENEHVLEKLNQHLPNRNYGVAHADTQDKRGIDVAFLYDSDKYENTKIFSHFIQRRNATRDILQADFTIKDSGKELVIIGNHWPSRMGGDVSSEPYRMMAGENLAYFVSRITEIKGDNIPIVICGDFNDEPFDRSITDYARATRAIERVKSSRSIRLYNLMWDEMGKAKASHVYGGFPGMIDQLMVSKSVVKDNAEFTVKIDSVRVLDFDELTNDKGEPIRFGRPKKGLNEQGYSDHLPLAMILEEL